MIKLTELKCSDLCLTVFDVHSLARCTTATFFLLYLWGEGMLEQLSPSLRCYQLMLC